MNWLEHEPLSADVVVVGGGGAGLRAAYEAAAQGASTILVLKGRLTRSGATAFGVAELAGFSVPDGAVDPLDSPDVHFADIMRVGQGCNDERLVRILVDEAISAAHDLERWGIQFVMDPNTGKPLVAMGDFASRPRNRKIYHHGKPITEVLAQEIAKLGVVVLEHNAVLGLLKSDAGIEGVLCADENGVVREVRAGATVLATGGAGQLFERSLMPPDITGDGYAWGYRNGAKLVNMEFMQAGFGTVRPSLNIVLPWYWALLPRFTDRDGQDILDGVLPPDVEAAHAMKTKVKHYPFSTSDASRWLEIAAKRAIDEQRVPDSGSFLLDLRNVDQTLLPPGGDLSVMWPISKDWMKRKRMDVDAQPLEIGLFGHSINGGMVINDDCETTVPNLLAVGETAGGPYGADRLGGNMLLTCQVFGRRAGRRAAELGMSRRGLALRTERPELRHLALGGGSEDVREVKRRVRAAMSQHVLIIRSAKSLDSASQELGAIRESVLADRFRIDTPAQAVEMNEAWNLLDVGEIMVAAASIRRETRGSHFRSDFPQTDSEWDCPVQVELRGDRPNARKAPFAPR
nr:FAD-dependent oxidoreductase [Paraburkholderia sp. Ac-20342]